MLRDNPELTEADKFRCLAAQNIRQRLLKGDFPEEE